MKKSLFALLLLVVMLLPMYAGLQRLRRLPPSEKSDRSEEDAQP